MPAGADFCLYALSAAIPLMPAKQRRNHPADWMETDARECRGDDVEDLRLRVLCPVSVRSDDQHGELGNKISAIFVSLPVGPADPTSPIFRRFATGAAPGAVPIWNCHLLLSGVG